MKINEILIKQTFLTKLVLKNDEDSLSKDLKVKIISARIEYAKVKKSYDEDIQQFISSVKPDNFEILSNKKDRTEEENKQLQDIVNQINYECNIYVQSLNNKDVNISDFYFTDEEYQEILKVNIDNDVIINGKKFDAPEFLEIMYSLFVKD